MKGRRFIPLLVVAAGLLAYHNSFTGTFVRDDGGSILGNPTIRHLWPIWQPLSPPHQGWLTVEGRPLINLSLAINYALGDYHVWGYHALNLTVHILAGLTLLGIVRRTLLQPALRERFGAVANELALATAVLWTVHPLQTEAVTYMIQRAESIMGLFYLLTLYCFVRGVESPLVARSTRDEPRARLWYGLSVAACALGMASKEVMISAPVMVMLYDRAFLSGSFREAWRRRWPLYLALASTWILLGLVLVSAHVFSYVSMPAQHRFGVIWWEYLATEPGVILYYLRLSVWPSPLSLNRPWPIARTWMSILPPTVAVASLMAAWAWAWRRSPVWGFAGAWFFLILAPSSSFIPLHDLIFEHRMYLSLAVVVSLVVLGLYSLAGRRSLTVFVVVAIGLGFLTWRRNQNYRSEVTLWLDTAAKFPNDPLQHYNLGVVLWKVGRVQEAIGHYEQALRLNPNLAGAHYSLGIALEQAGRVPEAREHYEQAVRLMPDHVGAHYSLGVALQAAGRIQEAISQYEQAVRLKPDLVEAHYNLGLALQATGRLQEAINQYEQTLRLKPDEARAHNNLGVLLAKAGKPQEALEYYEQAVRFKPDYAEAHNNLGVALEQAGRVQEAVEHWDQALRLKPDYAEAHNNLGTVLLQQGQATEAIEHYERALRIAPDMIEAHYNLGVALEQTGKIEEAIRHYEQALHLKPDFIKAKDGLTRLRAVQ